MSEYLDEAISENDVYNETLNDLNQLSHEIEQSQHGKGNEYTEEQLKIIECCGFTVDSVDYDYPDSVDLFFKNLERFTERGITYDMIKFCRGSVDPKGMGKLSPSVTFDSAGELFLLEKEGINLFNFLSKYPQKLQNLGGKEIKQIDLNANKKNFCFRGILEMMKSRGDMSVLPYPGENANVDDVKKWKESREEVIKEYEELLRYYIGLDFSMNENGERVPIDKSKTFDRIFYNVAANHIDEDRENDGPVQKIKAKFGIKQLQSFSENEILDYSSVIDENGNLDQTNQKKFIDDVSVYAKQHADEKILVFVGHHGLNDGSSGNGWTKEDWLAISQYSNVKLMTYRCFFGTVFNSDDGFGDYIYDSENDGSGDYIYDQLSQLSGFSNLETAHAILADELKSGFEKGLGFHELELYARLNYDVASPLTESFYYKDKVTGEMKIGNVGLAYHANEDIKENNV